MPKFKFEIRFFPWTPKDHGLAFSGAFFVVGCFVGWGFQIHNVISDDFFTWLVWMCLNMSLSIAIGNKIIRHMQWCIDEEELTKK